MKQKNLSTILLIVITKCLFAQGTYQDYQKAEKFLHYNIFKLVKNIHLKPNWINEKNDFWFKTETDSGYCYMSVSPNKQKLQKAFDHQILAQLLSQELSKSINPDSIPLKKFIYSKDMKQISFEVDSLSFTYNTTKNILMRDTTKEEKLNKNESKSPDGKWVAFVKHYNLYLKNKVSGEITQLTRDGIEKYDYASPPSWYKIVDESIGEQYSPEIYVDWSPDSRKFVATKLDRRNSGKLYLYQSAPDSGMRAKVWSYERALPGEELPKQEYYIFDVNSKSKTKVGIAPHEDIWSGFSASWTEDSKGYYFGQMERYYKALNLYFVNPESGNVKKLLREEAQTMIEYQMVGCKMINNGEYFIWMSEKDGWSHLYLYNKDGKLLNQITKGDYVVRKILHIDKKSEVIYFIASGKEENRDPYYQHLYRVKFDGSGLHLLTPEDAEHHIELSPDKEYFIDNFSRVDLKPKAVLRRLSDGKLIKVLQEANIDDLKATGWKAPLRFTVKARDGETDLYGILQFPTNFDSLKKYPIIDNTYSGPQAVTVPKSFRRGIWNDFLPLSEVGFILFKIDGMGTAMRSKAFHNVSYKNLGDIGAEDHMGAIKQLAQKYHSIDTSKVGIYGHSAGGYDAVHALLVHPEFYKVGVASAGNHDHRMAKAWWPEQYMGEPGEHYTNQSNLNRVKDLEGKLLLAHGDMDNNVNPACTYRLAAKLIQANKDFELIITPNDNHGGVWGNLYFVRRRMDFFVKHLWDKKPPKEFKFKIY